MTGRARVLELLHNGVEGRPALVLAPMATITHAAFRSLVSGFGGCDLAFTEMISAEALLGGTQFERYYLSLEPEPETTIYQIIGYSSETIAAAVRRAAVEPCAGIDLNLGCSAPHIVRKGGGIAWMQRPDELLALIGTVRHQLSDRTLSVKLRLGREENAEELVRLASRLRDCGIDFLTLHPKRQKDGANRAARWSFVTLLRQEISVPVIGNGGITDWSSYHARTQDEGSKRPGPIMIGRGAVRAPWLFAYLRAREGGSQSMEIDLHATLAKFFSLLERYQPREFWPSRARRIYPYFFRNVRFAHSIGARLGATGDYVRAREEALRYLEEKPERSLHVESG